MLRRYLSIFIIFLLFSGDIMASHYMGGEITWQCLQNGRYRFIMKLYRECDGINYNATESLTSNSPAGTIQMNLHPGGNPQDAADGNLDGKTDLSPNCWNPAQELSCLTVPGPNMGAVQEWYYTSDAAYPSGVLLNGTPPAGGWIFSHSSCCRNPCANLVNPTGADWFLRAIMYPYQGQNMNPCYDNSPVFAEIPSTILCTGYPFKYNHNAADKELDSLAFDWAPALQSATNPINYVAGYSFNSPLPGPAQNPANVAATMNPYTGEISYTSYTNGAFVTVTKVSAYRCGIKIAEIFREMQIVLLACPGNNQPPDVPGPFYNPITGLYEYVDTVYAGDVVDFDILSLDVDMLPNGNPNTIFLEASGIDFGAGFTNPNAGCVRPPCATLNPPPPLSAMVAVGTHFHWQTSCDHLTHPFSVGSGATAGCATLYNIHNFVIKVYDNYCPANGIKIATITIVVLPRPILDPPELKCISVDNAGNTTLSWIIPPDPLNTFDAYFIYTSNTPGGPYTLLDSIFTYTQTNYTHIGANAGNAPVYYYMMTRSGCYGAYMSATTSDSLASIHLDVTAVGNGQIADLNWNPMHTPPISSTNGWYHIYREFPAGAWSLLDSTTSLNYLDTITICDAFINYRIELPDTSGCVSVSNIDGAQLADGFPPTMPVLDSVSVDQITGKSILGWQPSTSPDTRKYYIYQKIGGPWFLIDSVFGISSTSYLNMASDPSSGPESYRIAAVDSCDKLSGMGLEHTTIHLPLPALDACADRIKLDWTSYVPDTLMAGYRIIYSENGGNFSLLGVTGSGTTQYDHIGLNVNSVYCYYIQGFNSSGTITSSSNVQCVLATKPNQPKYVYLRYATVNKNKKAQIGFFADTAAYIMGYKILRSDDGITYDTIDFIPPASTANVSYVDKYAQTDKQSYYYKVIVVDSCNLNTLVSNPGRTIHLTGYVEEYLENYLHWNIYEDRMALSYNVFREVENYEPYRNIYPLLFNETNFTDQVIEYTESGGRFYYYIQASLYDIFMDQYGFSDTVRSNEVMVLQPPRLYVPNAFAPNGVNQTFYPIGVFADESNFMMNIYDRWGQKVYQTTDIHQGWDGRFNGKECPAGVYSYYIKILTSKNKEFEKRGIVTLIR